MVGITTIISFSAFLALTVADGEAGRKDKGYYKVSPNTKPTLRTRDLAKRCEGTCEECFGTGYTQCPDSNYYCYKPGDTYYGLDSCSSDSGSSDTTYSSSAPAPTSTGSAGSSDFCSGTGATCVTCFGAGYLDCPDNYHCYNPNDPNHDTCEGGGSSSSGTSTCADLYGSGSIDCGTDSCYNPDEGDVCCSDGYHCEGGDTCSTEVGYCCSPGSSKYGCSGSGGGLSSYSYTYSYSSYSYEPTPTTDDFSFGSTATGSSSDASDTGVAQFGSSSSASRNTEIKIAGFILGILGLGMLAL